MSSTEWQKNVLQGVRGLKPYVGPPPLDEVTGESIVRLASNESPLGVGPKTLATIKSFASELARYPEGTGKRLREALAKNNGVEPNQIILGNGSNEILELTARTFLSPGTNAVFPEYCFAVYPLVTQATGADAIIVSVRAGSNTPWGQDLETLAEGVTPNTRVIFFANPNNPTGAAHTHADVKQLLKSVPKSAITVVDQAYADFSVVSESTREGAVQDLLSTHPGCIITRSFSKAYGLGGLRIGYGIASATLIEVLNRVRQPFNANAMAQEAALAALNEPEHLKRVVDLTLSERDRLKEALLGMGCEVLPSDGNFLSFSHPQWPNISDVSVKLMENGVLVRPLASYDMPQHLRVTIGTEEENQTFSQRLGQILNSKN